MSYLRGVRHFGPLRWMAGNGIGWFRLFGYGLHWNSREPLFSERHGYRKPLFTIGRWRVHWLSKGKGTMR